MRPSVLLALLAMASIGYVPGAALPSISPSSRRNRAGQRKQRIQRRRGSR